jgi:hypothetical protein
VRAACSGCGAATRWNTQQELDAFTAFMKKTGFQYLRRGVLFSALGVACGALVGLNLIGGLGGMPPTYGAILFMGLTTKGILTFLQGKRILRFH